MTPEQANMLQAIFDAIFNGGKSMPEGLPLKDLVYSLPGRTAAATAAYPVIRGTQKIPWVQETADAKTALLLAKPAPVLDVQAFALEVAKQVAPLLPADQAHQFVVALGQALPKQ